MCKHTSGEKIILRLLAYGTFFREKSTLRRIASTNILPRRSLLSLLYSRLSSLLASSFVLYQTNSTQIINLIIKHGSHLPSAVLQGDVFEAVPAYFRRRKPDTAIFFGIT